MSLTTARGPLTTDSPPTVTYQTEGPQQRLFLGDGVDVHPALPRINWSWRTAVPAAG